MGLSVWFIKGSFYVESNDNKLTKGVDTSNTMTDLRGKGMGGLEEISQSTYMHTCIAYVHRKQCDEGGGVWVDGDKVGGREIVYICNTVNS